MWMWLETLLQNFVNLTFFEPWLPWQWLPFWICSTPQKLPHTTVDIPTKFHEAWWKESKKKLNPPFFVSMATAAKFVQPILIFFGLSRSTRCGCCSYQVSSISVWRVTCYEHFCVSMAAATKFVLPIPAFFWLISFARCGCDRIHYCKNLWSLEWI